MRPVLVLLLVFALHKYSVLIVEQQLQSLVLALLEQSNELSMELKLEFVLMIELVDEETLLDIPTHHFFRLNSSKMTKFPTLSV